jgi:hypothetical protein
MNRFVVFLNDESSQYEIKTGETWHSHLAARPGLLTIVFWSQAPASVVMRVKRSEFEETSEQFGQVASFVLNIESSVEIILSFALSRRRFVQADKRVMSKALLALRTPSNVKESEIKKKAAVILRASVMTTKVATFLADEEEFCVVKRKAWMKGKKLPVPILSVECAIQNVFAFLQSGTRRWRQSSGSFSTMMRFIQRSKDLFKWHAELASLFLRRT